MTGLADALVALQKQDVVEEVRRRAEAGDDPVAIIDECREGMGVIGDRYRDGEFYLAELLLSADIFEDVIAILRPYLKSNSSDGNRGTIVLATPKGDIHDMGKNIVASMLEAAGFDVHDLGVDVDPNRIVDEVKRLRPAFVGFSALLTTTLPAMKTAIEMLSSEEDLRASLKVLIGGGVTTPEFKEYVGADFQTLDVMEGVDFCLSNGERR